MKVDIVSPSSPTTPHSGSDIPKKTDDFPVRLNVCAPYLSLIALAPQQKKLEELVYYMHSLTLADEEATSEELAALMSKLSLTDVSPSLSVHASDDNFLGDLTT